jgi:hypothetical protein
LFTLGYHAVMALAAKVAASAAIDVNTEEIA